MSCNGRSYLNKELVVQAQKRRKRCLIGGGVAAGFFLLGMVLGVTSNPDLKQYFTFYCFCFVISLALAVYGLLSGRPIDLARRYESIFACDTDGFISLDELKKRTGRDEWKIMPELEKLFQKGWFQHCTLQREGNPGVMLSDADKGSKGVGFVQMECPHCGGTNRLRAGTGGKCEFCGGAIRAD